MGYFNRPGSAEGKNFQSVRVSFHLSISLCFSLRGKGTLPTIVEIRAAAIARRSSEW